MEMMLWVHYLEREKEAPPISLEKKKGCRQTLQCKVCMSGQLRSGAEWRAYVSIRSGPQETCSVTLIDPEEFAVFVQTGRVMLVFNVICR